MALKPREKQEIEKLVEAECNSAAKVSQQLLRAPEAACMIEALNILARCTKDFSLRSGAKDEKFQYLRRPSSFQASLYQVTNAMSDAFRTGHDSVTKIQLHLQGMPTLMNDIMNAIDSLDNVEESKAVIDYARRTIKNSAKMCQNASNEASEPYVVAVKIIRELIESAKSAQGMKERRVEEAQIELDTQTTMQQQNAKVVKDLEEQIKKQEQIVYEVMEDYRDKMEKSSNISVQVALMLMDSLSSIVQTATGVVSDGTGFIRNLPLCAKTVYNNYTSAITILKKNEVESRAWERTLFKVLASITEEDMTDLTTENITSCCHNLSSVIQFNYETESGKMLYKAAKQLLHSFTDSVDLEERRKRMNDAKICVGVVRDIYAAHYEESRKNIELEAIRSQERQTIMEIQQKNLEVARSTMREERHQAEKLRKEHVDANEKVLKIMCALQKLNVEKIDLKEVLQYLEEGIKQLSEVQVAWENTTEFFKHIHRTVDGSLINHIDSFTDQIQALNDKKAGVLLREILIRECTKACATGTVLMKSANLYKAISDEYVLPVLGNAIINGSMTREEAKDRQTSIVSNYNKIKSKVQDEIDSHDFVPQNVMKALSGQGLDNKLAIKN